MKSTHRSALLGCAAVLVAAATAAAALAIEPAAPKDLQVARFNADKLHKPADLTEWIFLGASLGMGYNPGSFNAANPGQFQVALMEPTAYRYFVANGRFAPGSMFLLSFYDSDKQQRSINQNGFTQAELTNFEIHLIDPVRGEKGHAFYMFGANDREGSPVPRGNACVRCHVEHGAYDGTFAQFYPTLRPHIPKELLEKAARNHDIR